MYNIKYSKKAVKDIPNLKSAHLDKIAMRLIDILRENPYLNPPPFEKLVGNLKGLYSRRLNIQHRLVYEIREETKEVLIFSMWTHYGDN